MHSLTHCNEVIAAFEQTLKQPVKTDATLYTGIDLGTAFIVLAVMDEHKQPIAGAYRFADVVRDGMVVDYVGAVDIVSELKAEIEERLGRELTLAAAAIPPGTELVDAGAVKNVALAAGFQVNAIVDEPTAANQLIGLQNGAVVDIGGGTTGISIFQNGQVVHVSDEPTGGTHFTLVLAGAKRMAFESAEAYKQNASHHQEILPILHPVIDKVASIVSKTVEPYQVDELVLVGGTACLTGIEQRMEMSCGLATSKPHNPMFVTPLGIAGCCVDAGDEL